MLGIFLHSTHPPEKVIDTISRMGLSISVDSIHDVIRSLSVQSMYALWKLGQSLLTAYAYDNFDVNLKTIVSTVERSSDTLKHLTSGLLFPLQHGVTCDDLKCSNDLWQQSRLNSYARHDQNQPKSWRDIQSLHLNRSPGSPSHHEHFNAWKFLYDLCYHGPPYFAQFRSQLRDPKVLEQIPIIKTPIIAASAMDVNNSTVAGNIQAIENLLAQGGILNPDSNSEVENSADSDSESGPPDMTDFVVLVHGDLGTGERITALQLRWSIEGTPWRRFQHVVFVPRLFHVKMAAADALWRVFIHPTAARQDETCLMHDITLLRPHEIGIFASKPGFRKMHEVIGHDGICRRLDCWCAEVHWRSHHETLKDFARSKPSLEDLTEIANYLAWEYVANYKLTRTRQKSATEQDKQNENNLLVNKYFLLYEELSYAMNIGDIARLESCIVVWSLVFKATGKHKYATAMTEFLVNVHFHYPEGLRKAIRYHWLINPSGKPGAFRGVDWCVELNNLFIKVKNGGQGSNRTVAHIIMESLLVEIYRKVHSVIEKNFMGVHQTTSHSGPDMTKTFGALLQKMQSCGYHVLQIGRGTSHEIADLINLGYEQFDKITTTGLEGQDNINNEAANRLERPEAEDIIGEL
ncbi:hypothetical protein EV363DRAFT_433689 [Boletus edulis]|nr:hypothetical protein EV363DRAFT_433689 [Boletus edulis]